MKISDSFQKVKTIVIIHKKKEKHIFLTLSRFALDFFFFFFKLFWVEFEHSLSRTFVWEAMSDLAAAHGSSEMCQEDSSNSSRPLNPHRLSPSTETRDPDHKRCLRRLSGSVNPGQQSWLEAQQ